MTSVESWERKDVEYREADAEQSNETKVRDDAPLCCLRCKLGDLDWTTDVFRECDLSGDHLGDLLKRERSYILDILDSLGKRLKERIV